MHLSFLTSHNLLFFRFCKTSKKTTFSVFLSFFLVKSPKSQSLKLNILRTAWPIFMILVSFCRILNCLSDEINLFWRCSSPLSTCIVMHVLKHLFRKVINLRHLLSCDIILHPRKSNIKTGNIFILKQNLIYKHIQGL